MDDYINPAALKAQYEANGRIRERTEQQIDPQAVRDAFRHAGAKLSQPNNAAIANAIERLLQLEDALNATRVGMEVNLSRLCGEGGSEASGEYYPPDEPGELGRLYAVIHSICRTADAIRAQADRLTTI